MLKQLKSSKGFTLIEILIVVAVIAILSSVALVGANQARGNARDKDRLAQLKQLQVAVEIYGRINGRYPQAGCARGAQWTGNISTYGSCAVYIDGIIDLMDPLPSDPVSTEGSYLYKTDASGTSYKIMSWNSLEQTTVAEGQIYSRCDISCTAEAYCQDTSGDFSKTYAVYSNGAKCW